MLFDPKISNIFSRVVKYGELGEDNILNEYTALNQQIEKLDQSKYVNCFIESSNINDDIYEAVTFYSQYLNYLRERSGYIASVMPVLDMEQIEDFQVHVTDKINKIIRKLESENMKAVEKEVYLYLINTNGLAQIDRKDILMKFNYILQVGGRCGAHMIYVGSLSDLPTECRQNLHTFYLN